MKEFMRVSIILQPLMTLWIIIGSTDANLSKEYDSDQNVTSPNYPLPFGRNEERIYKVFIRNKDSEPYLVTYFDAFDIVADPLDPKAVSLKIEDHFGHVIGVFSDNAPPHGFVTRANKKGFTLMFRFKSHVKVPVNVTGFSVHFKRMNTSDIDGPNKISGNSSGYITSPGYPLNYPINQHYVYFLETPLTDGIVQFEFMDLDLGPGADIGIYDANSDGTPYLIYTFRYKQGMNWRYYLSGNVMTLVLNTGTQPTHAGFNLTYIEYCRIAGEELPCSLLPHSAMTTLIVFIVSICGIAALILILVGCTILCRR